MYPRNIRIRTSDAICDLLGDISSVRGTGSKLNISIFRPHFHQRLLTSGDIRLMADAFSDLSKKAVQRYGMLTTNNDLELEIEVNSRINF